MSHILRKILIAAIFMYAIAIQSASLINLDVNFENDQWNEILKRHYGQGKYQIVNTTATDKCLEIGNGVMLKTQTFKYFGGMIKIALDARTTDITPDATSYKVAWCSVSLVDKQGKVYGHHDLICTGKANGWKHYSVTLNNLRNDTSDFFVSVGNVGRNGTLWVDNLKIEIEMNGKQLCGDPGFNGQFAVDHWYYLKMGHDWDNLMLSTTNSTAEYQKDVFPDGGKSLHLKNTTTFHSARYAYNGEPLIFGGWTRQKDIKPGVREWAKSGYQLVVFDIQGRIIGHYDLSPFCEGNAPWTYFSSFIPAGAFRRDAAYLEIWPRIFEGATGDAWFASVQLIILPNKNNSHDTNYDAAKAFVTIDATNSTNEPIRPVWNATDISYFMTINENVAKTALSAMRKEGVSVLRCREFLKGGGILKKIDQSGKPVYDWTFLDNIIDWAVKEQNFTLTATIESTPEQIASKQSKSFYNRSAPQDYQLWGRITEELISHWIERYGLNVVKNWTFECWNEPYSERYFQGTTDEFIQIFNSYINAMERLKKKYKAEFIVATSSDVNCSPWFKLIFDGLRENDKLSIIKVISMHVYSGYVNSFSCLKDSIGTIKVLVDSYPELKGAPLILTEVNGASMPNPINDSSAAAAWNVKANRVYLDNGVQSGYFFAAIDYLYSRDNIYFTGGLGVFNKAGVPKPVFNSIVLLNRLQHGKRLPSIFSNEPLDGIAAMDPANNLKILLTSFDETKLNEEYQTDVKVVVNWPSAPNRLNAIVYRIDSNHANSYVAWQKMGKPEISKSVTNILTEANELKIEPFSEFEFNNGKLIFNLKMPGNSVIYLEFKK